MTPNAFLWGFDSSQQLLIYCPPETPGKGLFYPTNWLRSLGFISTDADYRACLPRFDRPALAPPQMTPAQAVALRNAEQSLRGPRH